MFVGQVIVGGVTSRMTTMVKAHCPTTTPLAVTTQLMGCDPSPSGVPTGGLQFTCTCTFGQWLETMIGYDVGV